MGSEWSEVARLVRRTGFGATGAEVDAAVKEGAAKYVARILAADPDDDPGAKRTPAPTFAALPRPNGKKGMNGMGTDPDDDPDGSGDSGGNGDMGGNAGSDDEPDDGSGDEKDKRKDPARQAYKKAAREQAQKLTLWWLHRMTAVETAFGEKATFVWHSHFATSLKKVKAAALMDKHIQRQRSMATGSFDTLARTMLTDAALQRWLDNQKNTVKGPNENLSREFMELFALGHGDGYTEKDVQEGARALTGYKADRRTGEMHLVPRLHDQKSKTLLGRTGNLDAKGFADAVLASKAVSPYIVTRLWTRYVSNSAPDKAVLARLVDAFGEKRDIAKLLTAMFTDDSFTAAEGTYVIGPTEWLIGAVRALRPPADEAKDLMPLANALNQLGQLPLFPPSVGGWPSGSVWMTTAAADLRFRTAGRLVQQADLSGISGSTTAKLEALGHRLGVAEWSSQSLGVLKGAADDPKRLVAVALNTPEYLVH